MLENVLDFGPGRSWLHPGLGDRDVRGPGKQHPVPGQEKENPAISGFRYEETSSGRHSLEGQYDVRALAGQNLRLMGGMTQPPEGIGKDPRRIDDHPGSDANLFIGFQISCNHSGQSAIVLQKGVHLHIGQDQSSQMLDRAGQADCQPGVIELRVIVLNRAFQATGLENRKVSQGLGPGEKRRGSEAARTGQEVIDLEPRSVEEPLPLTVHGNQVGQLLYQMRSTPDQAPPFGQGLTHQSHVSLTKVANTTMNQLGAAA